MVAANDILGAPGDGGFEKFVVFGVSIDNLDAFFRDDEFGKLVAVAGNAVNRRLLEPEFGAIDDFKDIISIFWEIVVRRWFRYGGETTSPPTQPPIIEK